MGMLAVDLVERTRRDIIRWCQQAETTHELLAGVACRVRTVVDYDAGAWLSTDPMSSLFTDGHVEGYPAELCDPYFHNELAVPDVLKFTELAGRGTPSSSLYRETRGRPESSHLWREVYRPNGFDDELRAVFRLGGAVWGVASITRRQGRPTFSEEERNLLVTVGAAVAAGLRRLALAPAATAASPDGPGLVLIHADGSVTAGTEAGGAWLERLAVDDPGEQQRTSLRALRALVAGGIRPERQLRLRARDGRWVTLHAAPLTGDAATIAVIVEPTPPSDIATVMSLAYGLSPREREVTLAVARGHGTADIARRLFISPHTVRDHLKSAFAKIGVTSRTELVGVLFHRHYAEDLMSSVGGHH